MDTTVPGLLSESDNDNDAADVPPSMGFDAARLQTCFNVLARVEEQLRFADSKAAFIATLHAFLVGPLAGNAVGIRAVVAAWDPAAHILLGLAAGSYAVMFLVTMGIVAAAVLPRTRRNGRPASKAFFGRIAQEYSHDPRLYVRELARLSDRDWLDEIGHYIVDASTIAATKHRLVRRATLATLPTVALWVLMVVVLVCAGHVGGR